MHEEYVAGCCFPTLVMCTAIYRCIPLATSCIHTPSCACPAAFLFLALRPVPVVARHANPVVPGVAYIARTQVTGIAFPLLHHARTRAIVKLEPLPFFGPKARTVMLFAS